MITQIVSGAGEVLAIYAALGRDGSFATITAECVACWVQLNDDTIVGMHGSTDGSEPHLRMAGGENFLGYDSIASWRSKDGFWFHWEEKARAWLEKRKQRKQL